eukprot:TRINITY_DN9494_c0_g1_i1.p1 TRINITY_DN9494_c0_g1~~TRINITY_DN9494_c0_g1_i1.p1  ORF type:complete len:516 (-),score=73.97 TRINITY_DN9494_c0_g1_i1:526-2073(-)
MSLWRRLACSQAALVFADAAYHRLQLERAFHGELVNTSALEDVWRSVGASAATVDLAAAGQPDVSSLEVALEAHRKELDALLQDGVANLLAADVGEALHNVADMLYTAEFEVGTPRRKMRLIVDTGSSDMWMVDHKDHPAEKYNAAASKTAADLLGTVHKTYGKGTITGRMVEDSVCFASACVKKQPFLLVDNISSLGLGALAGKVDGLVGLSFPPLATWARGRTFLEQLPRTLDDHADHSLAFALEIDGKTEGSSSIAFSADAGALMVHAVDVTHEGGVKVPVVPLRSYAGPMNIMGAAQYMYWLVKCAIKVGGFAWDAAVVLDSGTSLITLPQGLYAPLMNLMLPMGALTMKLCFAVNGQMFCACETPVVPLTFWFRDEDSGRSAPVTLTAEDILIPVAEVQGRRLCRVAITPTPRSMPFVILGDAFLRRVYTVYDVENKAVTLFPTKATGEAYSSPPTISYSSDGSSQMGFVALAAVASSLLSVLAFDSWRRCTGRLSTRHDRADMHASLLA